MKRRTLVRKLGAAGIATATLTGPAAAKGPFVADPGVERELDVSSVEGTVSLDELLEPHEVANLPAGVDSTQRVVVAPEADVIALGHCCEICCEDQVFKDCTCSCCVCDDSICFGDGSTG